MLPQEILEFHMRSNAISCILRAVLPQNITIISNIILVNLQLFSRISEQFPKPLWLHWCIYKANERDAACVRNLF